MMKSESSISQEHNKLGIKMSAPDGQFDFSGAVMAQDLMFKSDSQPIYLSSIEIEGGETFSKNFFQKIFRPSLQSQDSTLGHIVKQLKDSHQKLVKTSVFQDVKITMNTDFKALIPKDLKKYNKDKPIPAKVLVNLHPINLNSGDGFINFNNEDHLNLKLDYLNNNFNGNGELVDIGVDYNPYKPHDHLIAHGKFVSSLNNPAFKFVVDLTNSYQNNQSWLKASEKSTLGIIGLKYSLDSLKVLTGVSLARRTLHDIDDSASESVKVFAGDYLRSSVFNRLKYTDLSYLNVVTKNFPTDGFSFSLDNEVASIQEQNNPSNQNVFIKSTFAFNGFKSIFDNRFTAHLGGQLGNIIAPSSGKIHASDQFYLGGVHSFQGFAKNSVNVNGDSQFFKLGLTLYSYLPRFIYYPVKVDVPDDKDLHEPNPLRLYGTALIGDVTKDILEHNSAATSVGVGLKYFNQWANLDIGYYVSSRIGEPLSNTVIKDGLQFSVSLGGSNKTFPKLE